MCNSSAPIPTTPTGALAGKPPRPLALDSPKNVLVSKNSKNVTQSTRSSYQVALSLPFVFVVVALTTWASFHIGVLVHQYQQQQPWQDGERREPSSSTTTTTTTTTHSKQSKWIQCQSSPQPQRDALCLWNNESLLQEEDSSSSSDDDDDDDEDSTFDDSLGQHVLATLTLPSLQRQADLVLQLLELAAQQPGWTLQKYHGCHQLSVGQVPQNCILLFEQGHRMVLLHHEDVTTSLDVFSNSYTNDDDEEEEDSFLLDWLWESQLLSSPHQQWSYKPRATLFDISNNNFDAGLNDLYNFMLGSSEYTHKELVARAESPFQEVTIYDTIDPRLLHHASYQKSLPSSDDTTTSTSYYQDHADLFQPDRQMFLDGVVQSRRYGERAYHEALVHPAMVLHPHPQRVVIVGAGEGATLREVLKHATLQQVIMIEIDDLVMDLSRQYLGQWNDCSDIILPDGMVNPTGNCFDDPRATVYAKDAIAWFMEQYPPKGNNHKDGGEALFDVIIMDALDPGDKVEFSDMLFDNTELVATFHRALTPQGIFVCQTGEQQFLDDANPMWTRDKHALLFLQNLGKVGFQRFFDYDEGSTRFSGLWSYLLASKDSDRSRWFANPAQVNLELQQRAMPTKSGEWPFYYFDGATMQSYQATTRSVATTACRTNPDWPACQRGTGLLGEGEARLNNIPVEQGLVLDQDNDTAVAVQDLEPNQYLGLEECVEQSWDIPHSVVGLIEELASSVSVGETASSSFYQLFQSYGMPATLVGEKAMTLDLGRDTWMKQCPVIQYPLESVAEGISNPMLERFWRIHTCAATRQIQQPISRGAPVPCHAS